MKSNRKYDSQRLDTMLTDYCAREPHYTFRVKRRTVKKRSKFKIALASVCALAIAFSGAFAYNLWSSNQQKNIGYNKPTESSAQPLNFVITVDAAEIDKGNPNISKLDDISAESSDPRDTVMIQPVTIYYDESKNRINIDDEEELYHIDEDGNYVAYYESEENAPYKQDVMQFRFGQTHLSVNGDDIASFDVSTNCGEFTYLNYTAYEEYHNPYGDTPEENIAKYFKKGEAISEIPFDSDNPQNSIVTWYPSEGKIIKAVAEETGIDISDFTDEDGNISTNYHSMERDKLVSDTIERLMGESDALAKYFGADIYVTVHYKDGRSETAKLEITFNKNGAAYAR